jgi:hypothetical protein
LLGGAQDALIRAIIELEMGTYCWMVQLYTKGDVVQLRASPAPVDTHGVALPTVPAPPRHRR